MRGWKGRQIGVGVLSLYAPFTANSTYALKQHSANGSASFDFSEGGVMLSGA